MPAVKRDVPCERPVPAGTAAVTPACAVGENEHRKNVKTVSLETLQSLYRLSIVDAAKQLGVCRTTLKRICRDHGALPPHPCPCTAL